MIFDLDRLNISDLTRWLEANGCEILPPTNKYEVVRWKGQETGVLYTSGKTSGPYAHEAVFSFIRKKEWTGGPVRTNRKSSYSKHKQNILDRDGGDCFYCGHPLGQDITLEHIMPLVSGGPNTLSNMVLAHYHCNSRAGHMTIVEKVKMAIDLRTPDDDPPPWN